MRLTRRGRTARVSSEREAQNGNSGWFLWGVFGVFAVTTALRAENRQVKAFVQSVTAAAVGAIAGVAYILGRRALIDLPAIIIGVTTFFQLRKAKKIPEPLLILAAGIAGLLLFKGQ